jgi:hypothetical protein
MTIFANDALRIIPCRRAVFQPPALAKWSSPITVVIMYVFNNKGYKISDAIGRIFLISRRGKMAGVQGVHGRAISW